MGTLTQHPSNPTSASVAHGTIETACQSPSNNKARPRQRLPRSRLPATRSGRLEKARTHVPITPSGGGACRPVRHDHSSTSTKPGTKGASEAREARPTSPAGRSATQAFRHLPKLVRLPLVVERQLLPRTHSAAGPAAAHQVTTSTGQHHIRIPVLPLTTPTPSQQQREDTLQPTHGSSRGRRRGHSHVVSARQKARCITPFFHLSTSRVRPATSGVCHDGKGYRRLAPRGARRDKTPQEETYGTPDTPLRSQPSAKTPHLPSLHGPQREHGTAGLAHGSPLLQTTRGFARVVHESRDTALPLRVQVAAHPQRHGPGSKSAEMGNVNVDSNTPEDSHQQEVAAIPGPNA